jgi:uncharacterized protein (TIGR00375 family)
MMPYIADFHIHSKYSRATSKDMDIEHLASWAKVKGISLLGTGDFTHPQWFAEIKKRLDELDYGVFRYGGVDFMLTTEVSSIYFKAGRTRKVHNIIFVPGFKIAGEVNAMLSEYGDLSSDGRPIVSLDCAKLAKKLFSIAEDIIVVPGHAWTPHFSIFGSNSGFDSPEECFEDMTPKIYSLETGLSSDPAMNWRWSKLDNFTLMSNSDSHSPAKIGREANVFNERINYKDLIQILKTKDKRRFLYTVEFFPEEGKYHWDGHRVCGTRLSPQEAMRVHNKCPRCGKAITIGVMHRLEALADRPEGFVLNSSPSYRSMVPLPEIIGGVLGVGPDTATVAKEYAQLVKNCGSEFHILLEMPEEELREKCPSKIAKGILNVRKGALEILPGYDGEYGKVKIFKEGDEEREQQLSFF